MRAKRDLQRSGDQDEISDTTCYRCPRATNISQSVVLASSIQVTLVVSLPSRQSLPDMFALLSVAMQWRSSAWRSSIIILSVPWFGRIACILMYAGCAGVGDEVGVVGRESGVASVGSGKHGRLIACGFEGAQIALL
jgi:hypothetical protein